MIDTDFVAARIIAQRIRDGKPIDCSKGPADPFILALDDKVEALETRLKESEERVAELEARLSNVHTVLGNLHVLHHRAGMIERWHKDPKLNIVQYARKIQAERIKAHRKICRATKIEEGRPTLTALLREERAKVISHGRGTFYETPISEFQRGYNAGKDDFVMNIEAEVERKGTGGDDG